jgi:hypothetical protein
MILARRTVSGSANRSSSPLHQPIPVKGKWVGAPELTCQFTQNREKYQVA